MIITHLHYDHVGNFEIFPRATFHLQDREMAYATGRYMCHQRLRMPFDVENVTGMVRELYRGRVAFHDGDEELASGISLHLVGGHSHGLQFVRVFTKRGWVVVASDAAHFYANMATGNPFPIVLHVGEMLEGHRKCRRLAASEQHVVPGHDPLVMARYPAPSPELEGIAVRLDVAPVDELPPAPAWPAGAARARPAPRLRARAGPRARSARPRRAHPASRRAGPRGACRSGRRRSRP